MFPYKGKGGGERSLIRGGGNIPLQGEGRGERSLIRGGGNIPLQGEGGGCSLKRGGG